MCEAKNVLQQIDISGACYPTNVSTPDSANDVRSPKTAKEMAQSAFKQIDVAA
jgi:hypothetical protein